MALISFHPRADGPLGWTNKRSERDCDAMVHEVCYDPMNADSHAYKFIKPHLTLVLWNSGTNFKVEKTKTKQMHNMQYASVRYPDTFFPKECSADAKCYL